MLGKLGLGHYRLFGRAKYQSYDTLINLGGFAPSSTTAVNVLGPRYTEIWALGFRACCTC